MLAGSETGRDSEIDRVKEFALWEPKIWDDPNR
jgi:hypothetical protein